VEVDPSLVKALIRADYIPVIASVARGEDGGSYNVNADDAAFAIAKAVGAHKIIYLTDVDGFYEDFDDKDSLVSQMTLDETRQMLADGRVSKGMIPKLQSCVACLEGGVPRAHIINGTKPHSLLIELLTTGGSGTLVYDPSYVPGETHAEDMAPLGALASRLSENLSEGRWEV
jgi:acetylglutamate kinase